MNKIVKEDLLTIISQDLPWEKLSGCKILVTGAGGFLGGYLTRTLLMLNDANIVDEPIHVVAAVRNISDGKQRLSDISDQPSLDLVACDLSQANEIKIEDCNYIFHAASIASPRYYGEDPIGTIGPNVIGTSILLKLLASSSNPRGFLFVSSSEVYGKTSEAEHLREDNYGVVDPVSIRNCYAESKRLGETLCVAWGHQYGIPTFIVRPFHTYGPGLKENDGRVFSDFAFNIIKNKNILMKSDGSALRAYCYVTDAIYGFFTALLKGKASTPYNVANPAAELSVRQLANLLVNLYPHKGLTVEQQIGPTSSSYIPSNFNRLAPNINRLSSLGWHPTVNPETGFRRMIESYINEKS